MGIYLGTFLIAFATLALEVTLSRILSLITWYHLAFFAISTAMLGMTAGAVTVYLKPKWYEREVLNRHIASSCVLFSLSVPFSLAVLCHTALPSELMISWNSLPRVVLVAFACSVPFYFSGIAVTAVLTKQTLPIGKVYASDLAGAAFGCLFVLAGLEILSAPRLILGCSLVGVLAAAAFYGRSCAGFEFRRVISSRVGILTGLVFLALFLAWDLRPVYVKGRQEDASKIMLEKWNSFSRVVVEKGRLKEPHFWGASRFAPMEPKLFQYPMVIDGVAGTTVTGYKTEKDIEHLGFDVTNIAYFLRPGGTACVVGLGGGRDVQSALLFGYERVVGIDVNPVFVKVLQNEFRDFAGIAGRPEVQLVADEARSYLSRTSEKFSLIQMSLIDTWAATGAGAFSLTENALYTVQGWRIFYQRLEEDGIFTVARYFNPLVVNETGRVLSLAVATLLDQGIRDYSRHIAMVTRNNISVLLLSKRPFQQADVNKLSAIIQKLDYRFLIRPGMPPEHPVFRALLSVRSAEELERIEEKSPFNFSAPTDESPYFFNMLRMGWILKPIFHPGVLQGNLLATTTLIELIAALLILCAATVVFPLLWGKRLVSSSAAGMRELWPGALYFSLIGAGFMLIEIGLVQTLSVFLGHPTYALGILLFTIILSAGLGSYLSEKLPLTKSPWRFVFPLATALVLLLLRALMLQVTVNMVASPIFLKILASIGMIFPLGILLGFFFPVGMRLAASVAQGQTPWYWALNGIFGVLCSAMAVFFSIFFGISTNFYLSAILYLATPLCLWRIAGRIRNP